MIKSSFPKIYAVGGHRNVASIFDGEVEVTEKLDGSQFIIGRDPDGVLHMRSKGAVINWQDIDSVQKLFRPTVNYLLSVQALIFNDMILYGEAFCAPRHNTLKYDRVPKNHFAIFGRTDWDCSHYYDHQGLCYMADILKVDVVPLLHKGPLAKEDVKDLIKESYLGGTEMEGVVIKNYKPTMYLGNEINLMSSKYVTENFKEVHKQNPEYKSGKSKVEDLFKQFNNTNRWEKAVQRLNETGSLANEPKDIGPLMKSLNQDLESEGKDFIQEELWKIYKKQFLSTATKGFAQWYKETLFNKD